VRHDSQCPGLANANLAEGELDGDPGTVGLVGDDLPSLNKLRDLIALAELLDQLRVLVPERLREKGGKEGSVELCDWPAKEALVRGVREPNRAGVVEQQDRVRKVLEQRNRWRACAIWSRGETSRAHMELSAPCVNEL
jgi:hypothetical protein